MKQMKCYGMLHRAPFGVVGCETFVANNWNEWMINTRNSSSVAPIGATGVQSDWQTRWPQMSNPRNHDIIFILGLYSTELSQKNIWLKKILAIILLFGLVIQKNILHISKALEPRFFHIHHLISLLREVFKIQNGNFNGICHKASDPPSPPPPVLIKQALL